MDLQQLYKPSFVTLDAKPSPSPSASPIPNTIPDEDVEPEYALTFSEEQTVEKCFEDEKSCEARLSSAANPEQNSSMPWYWRTLSYIGAAIGGYLILK